MWLGIGLGLIAVMWFVGAVINPDKNAPTNTGAQPAITQTAQQIPPH